MGRPFRIIKLDRHRLQTLRTSGAVVGAAGVFLSAALLLIARGRGSEIGLMLLALAPALVAAAVVTLLVHQLKRVRLVLGEDGVEYHAFGSSVRAGWDAIVALGPVTHGLLSGEGIQLRGAVERRASLLLRLSGLSNSGRGIPLAPFVVPLRGSWLEMELRRRAPALQPLS